MLPKSARSLVAEAIGTFALCFAGILAISAGYITGDAGASTLTSVAFAHGLVLVVMISALAAHSGAHFNPAVTVGFVATGRMNPALGAAYVAAQLVGAYLASALLGFVFGAEVVTRGTPALAAAIPPGVGVTLETIATFFLVLVIFGTAVDERAPKSVFPFAIGLTVAVDIMAIGPITGAAMNPARAFGPALAAGAWSDHWVYWAGPLLGGILAAALQHFFFLARAPGPVVAERGGPALEEQRHA